jgi:hypothetical protein
MTRDIRDAEDHRQARSVDAKEMEIPQPSFITLGHELGHVGHFMDGSVLKHQSLQSDLEPAVAGGADMAPWEDLEEMGNILNAENDLRAAHGLKPRHGHGNQEHSQKARVERTIEPLYQMTKSLPQGVEPLIHAHLTKASNARAAGKIIDARRHAGEAAALLSTNVAQAFPTARRAQRRQISGHLRSIASLRTQAPVTPSLARYKVGDPATATSGGALDGAEHGASAAHKIVTSLPKAGTKQSWTEWATDW